MPSIGRWSPECMDVVPDIALVRKDDSEVFCEFVRSGVLVCPQRLYVIAPNGYGAEEFLALHILCKLGAFDTHAVLGTNQDAVHLFRDWRALVQALEEFDHASAITLIAGIPRHSLTLATRLSSLLNVVGRYVTDCVHPIATGALFRTYSSVHAINWWEVPVEPLMALTAFSKDLASMRGEMPKLVALEQAAESAKRKLSALAGGRIEDKFYDLSAFCLGLAQRHTRAKSHQTAFLLAYRALDFYFQSVALAEGVMIETSDGVRYRDKLNERVYLVDTEFYLVQAQKVASNKNRRDFIVLINTVRNQLLMTHGAHAVTASEAESCITNCEGLVSRLEGTSKWVARSASFFPPLKGVLELLFESVPDIDTYIEEQALP